MKYTSENLLKLIKTKGKLVKRMKFTDDFISFMPPVKDCKEYFGAVSKVNLFGNITHVYIVYQDFEGNIKYYDFPRYTTVTIIILNLQRFWKKLCKKHKKKYKKVKYRPQRGTLKDSMRECREFATLTEMKEVLAKESNGLFSADDILLDEYSWKDDRIDWEKCRYVCVARFGEKMCKEPQCIGICSIE